MNQKFELQAATVFERIEELDVYLAIMWAMDRNIHDLISCCNAINYEHPKAKEMARNIHELSNFSKFLSKRFANHTAMLEGIAQEHLDSLTYEDY
jgi:hypothetical protein